MIYYRLSFYVPEQNLEQVKEAIFHTGAGRLGNYAKACCQVLGKGQFLPLESSQPTIGEHGKLEYVDEYQVDIVCSELNVNEAIKALKSTHPYEEPAYAVFKMESL